MLYSGVCLLMLWGVVGAQKSWYAGSNSAVLGLHPRYTSTDASVGNRGEVTTEATTTPLPEELQGTLHDPQFVKWVAEWPEERQPYWFKNRNAISNVRNQNVDGDLQRPQQNFQSPFLTGQQEQGASSNENGRQTASRFQEALWRQQVDREEPRSFKTFFHNFE